ncbi:patatin-like phospholipase family protein [Chitinibacter sp. SCUT-21]|uniref:patatin-like phospholipase family protein n=1 Tax=Chitinibacter sp. SCUT-21 TaxID=2970891 RepID=UPI0035A579F5
MKARHTLFSLLLSLGALSVSVAPSAAQDLTSGNLAVTTSATQSSLQPSSRPRVGLVLGGGGARGFAHIGVLKILEQNHIPVDCVIGTSIGSLVGGAYASGRTTDEMTERIQNANWDDLLSSSLPRQLNSYRKKSDDALGLIGLELGLGDDLSVKLPTAAISTQKIEYFLRELTFAGTVPHFDEMPIPYRAIATDLVTGDMVVFSSGDVVTAMRASMAVPGVFPAVQTDKHFLVDGGLVRNMPIDVARNTCADVVIAVDVGSEPLKRGELNSIFSMADQYTRLMMLQNVKPQLDSLTGADVLISPTLPNLSSSDFNKSADMIKEGEIAALNMLSQLQRYAVSPEQFAAWSQARVERHLESRAISQVQVKDPKHVNPVVVEKALEVKVGEKLNLPEFYQNLGEVYARGDFSQLDYELSRSGQTDTLNILPIEKSWGPNYLNFGLGFGTDFEGSTPWSISAMYRRTWINDLGGEWKTVMKLGSSQTVQSEFYQPLQIDGLAFIAPYITYKTGPLALWYQGIQLGNYNSHHSAVGIDLGSTLGQYGEFRIGPVANKYKLSESIGLPLGQDASTQDMGLRASLFYDQLDNYFFPTTGEYLNLNAYASLKNGDDINQFADLAAEFRSARPFKSGVMLLTLKGQELLGDSPEFLDVSWLGGFMNLSSYRYQEILTNRFLYGSLQYYQPMSVLANSYWGLGLEGAYVMDQYNGGEDNAWHGSLMAYLAYDSYIGPLYLGFAYGDNKKLTSYLMLGKQF